MLLQNRYEYNPLTDFIADGSAARVYLAFDNQTDSPVIVKFYHDLSVEHQTFQNNMERIKQLDHPNLTRLHNYFVMETINYLGQLSEVKVGIWEYVPNGVIELPLKDPAAENTLRGIIAGLQYLYANGCAHLDLHTDNVLIAPNGQVKLNNYEITNTNPENEPNQDADLKGLGEVLHHYCTGQLPGDNLPELMQLGIREVYAVIIADCLQGKSMSVNQVLTTLNEYERNKRFAEVLPLQTKQAQTRYVFEMDDDLLEDTSHSWVFKAFDNLLDESVTLEVFKDDPTVALLNSIERGKYAYLFKLNLPDDSEPYKTALAGIVATVTAPVVMPQPAQETTGDQPETEETPAVAETHTGDTAIIEVPENILTLPEEETPETEKAEKSTATYQEPVIDLAELNGHDKPETALPIAEETAPADDATTLPQTEVHEEKLDEETTASVHENPDENSSIVVISVSDHVEQTPETPDNSVAIEHVTEESNLALTELPEVSEEDFALSQNTDEVAQNIEFETIDLTGTGDNPDDQHVNTEVIVQKAMEEVNADMGEQMKEMENMQKEIEKAISINLSDTGIQENTGSIAPTGLIKVEALSELSKDIEESEEQPASEEHPDVHKDKYMDIAISTLKDEDMPASDTQFFEKEAMEQVQKDLEKLLSEDEKDLG